jgi:hypothetical protein
MQDGSELPPPLEANTESFFASLVEPQCGHFVPVQSLERANTSLSWLHFLQ